MFGIGMPELIMVLVIALIVIGPKKLPDLARALGRGIAEFKKATNEVKANLEIGEVEEELRGMEEELADSVSGLINQSEIAEESEAKDDIEPDSDKGENEERSMEKKEDNG